MRAIIKFSKKKLQTIEFYENVKRSRPSIWKHVACLSEGTMKQVNGKDEEITWEKLLERDGGKTNHVVMTADQLFKDLS